MSRTLLLPIIFVIGTWANAQTVQVLKTNSQSDFIPEGITIDEQTDRIFVSSINRHKIITVDERGRTKDFVRENQDGFMEGLGMKIDKANQLLWCTSIKKDSNRYHSKVHAFALSSGTTVAQFSLRDTASHLLNDLVVTASGDIYITDTYYGALYLIDKTHKQLELFSRDPLLRYPNGIAALDQNRLVVATYSNGLVLVNIQTRRVTKLGGAKDSAIAKGLDGLVLVDTRLYGVYNAADSQSRNAVVEYTLSATGDSIVAERILDRGNPLFRDPTTAAASSGKLYVIANSYLTEFNQNNTSTKGIERKLGPVTLLIYNIGQPQTGKIKGVYGHPQEFWNKGYTLKDLNVNAIFLHHKSIDEQFMRRARSEVLKVFAEFATLNGENYVEAHPEAWAIDKEGSRVKKATWFMGVCPTDQGFMKARLQELDDLMRNYNLDGVWLDYLHWHAQFEDPDPILPETCFNQSCIKEFETFAGIKVPGSNAKEKADFILKKHEPAWRKWRASVLAEWVRKCRNVVKSRKPHALLGIYHCPWTNTDFNNARYTILGLDYDSLKLEADVFSPMVYHKRMGREPRWVEENITWFSGRIGNAALIWPIVQAYNDPSVISAAEFEYVLRAGLSGRSSGVMMFTSNAVAEDRQKVDVMKKVYAEP